MAYLRIPRKALVSSGKPQERLVASSDPISAVVGAFANFDFLVRRQVPHVGGLQHVHSTPPPYKPQNWQAPFTECRHGSCTRRRGWYAATAAQSPCRSWSATARCA